MQDTGGEASTDELAARVARLEAELGVQREAMQALRAEVFRLQGTGRPDDYVLRPRKPEPLPPPSPPASIPAPHTPLPATPLPASAPGPAALGVPPAEVIAAAHMPFPSDTPSPAPMPSFVAPPVVAAKPQRSLENRIGSQWFNRLGILALLIGVAYFLKLAIDNHWIHTTATGRIISGLVVGAGVVLWSERFRRKGYGVFSYSLKAVGTGTLYLALWASFHLYHVLPPWAALLMMIGVTVWNAAMAWSQDAELLAVYALVGGFATPGLLGSGGNHSVFLFSYLLAMDLAVLFLVAKKPWQRLLLGSFPATIGYFIGWYSHYWSADQAGVIGLFVVLLSAPMIAVALVGKQREGVAEGLLTPIVAAGFLSLAMYSVLEDSGRHAWLPWTAVACGALYLLLMRLRRNGVAEAVHLALAITFLTIAIPLKAEGRWITIGWLAEGVALMYVAARIFGPEVQSRVRAVMRWMACTALTLGVAESIVFWVSQKAYHAFWNARFATELAAVVALALTAWLAREAARTPDAEVSGAPRWAWIALLGVLGTHIVAAVTVLRELSAYWEAGPSETAAYRDQLTVTSSAAFLTLYGAALLVWVVLRVRRESSRRALLRGMAPSFAVLGFALVLLTSVAGSGAPQRVVLNERFLFELIAVAALAVMARFARRPSAMERVDANVDVEDKPRAAEWGLLALLAALAAHLAAAATGLHEIATYWTSGGAVSDYNEQLYAISMAAFLMAYGAALMAWVTVRKHPATSVAERKSQALLATAYVGLGWAIMLVTPIVGNGGPLHVFWNARLGLEIAGSFALAATVWLAWKASKEDNEHVAGWVSLAAGGFVAFNLLVLLIGVREILTYFGLHAGGDAGLAESATVSGWLMLYAAALLAVGFWRRRAFIRWQGLILLVFTIGKVFLYDLRNLSSVYRVLSIVGLGVLLMAVSFAYQKDWLSLRDDSADQAVDPPAEPPVDEATL